MNIAGRVQVASPVLARRALKPVLRILVALPLVAILPLYSITLLIVLSPILLLSLFLRDKEVRGRDNIAAITREDDILFNRVDDVSKLIGCNTRGVQYRWSIFEDALASIASRTTKAALDFGAGSLRDSFELAEHGFAVTAVDINVRQLLRSRELYRWPTAPIIAQDLSAIAPEETFDVITAFDVLEHLTGLDAMLPLLTARLKPDGYMLVTVPNGLSVRERVGRMMYGVRVLMGTVERYPGVHHVNFHSQAGWTRYFEANGLRVCHHEMAIGQLANDWHFTHAFPIGMSGLGRRFPNLERVFCPQMLMRRLDLVDQNLKPLLRQLWGWNLFVLRRG